MSRLSVDRGGTSSRPVLTLAGELDFESAPTALNAAMAAMAAEDGDRGGAGGFEAIVVDLAGVTFLDSSGLGAFVEMRNAALARGGRLQFASVPQIAARVIELAGLDEAFGLKPQDEIH
jgi:anti-sigma B factor antagonist